MSFLEISAVTCGEAYGTVKANAFRHFRCAEYLSKLRDYPNAIAHLILGAEELIKSFVLLLESKNFNLRTIPGYKRLFNNHSTRHSIIKDFFSVWIVLRDLIQIKKKKKNDNTLIYLIESTSNFLNSVVSGLNNYQWWSNADHLKQKCFYVDFLNEIVSPNVIKMEDYLTARKHVFDFRREIRFLFFLIERTNSTQLEELKKNFNNADFRKLIEGTISRRLK